MSDYVWQSVEGQTRIACDCGECDRTIEVDDGYIQIYSDDGEELTAHLPDDYALCRRVPASAGVPVGAIRTLREYGIPLGMTYAKWHKACQEVQRWLDVQPQTGQGGE